MPSPRIIHMPRVERAYSECSIPHWHDVEMVGLMEDREDYVDEQITWWQNHGIAAFIAYEWLYNEAAPMEMTWPELRSRMIHDFT